jgi:hypothetical protein
MLPILLVLMVPVFSSISFPLLPLKESEVERGTGKRGRKTYIRK